MRQPARPALRQASLALPAASLALPVASLALLGAILALGCSPDEGSPEVNAAREASRAADVAPALRKARQAVLILSPAAGPVHGATGEVAAELERAAARSGFAASHASLSEPIDELRLATFCSVIFVHGAGANASAAVRRQLRRFVEAGGGVIFVHAPLPPTNDWGTARRWAGLLRAEHAEQRERQLFDASEEATRTSPGVAVDTGWHRFSVLFDESEVVLRADDGEPVAWRRMLGAGRVFVSDLGHDAASLRGDFAARHLAGALEWVAARGELDYGLASRAFGSLEKQVLARDLDEPIALALLPGGDGALFFTERRGRLKLYDPSLQRAHVVGELDVDAAGEGGLLGIALDPSFDTTGWLYLLATRRADGELPRRHRVSRFTYQSATKQLDLASEKTLLEVPLEPEAINHSGGALAISAKGDLFIATGDDTRIDGSDGFAPLDTRPGRESYDAARSAGNTNDLRGKVLRIRPVPSGRAEMPAGNLFGEGSAYAGQGRPEIYAMGFRNPFTLALDEHSGALYVGEPGPDASRRDPARGPAGADEINRIDDAAPGNFGWPFFLGDGGVYARDDADENAAASPQNQSPNNTGATLLPPAQSSLLAYGYTTSRVAPELGKGPRSVWLGSARVRPRPGAEAGTRLLAGDFMRNTLHWIDLDAAGEVERVERVAPGIEWHQPIHGAVASDGSIYVLEYGAGWYSQNPEAQLSRLVPAASRSAASSSPEPGSDAGSARRESSLSIAAEPNRSFFGAAPIRYQVQSSDATLAPATRVSLQATDSFEALRTLRNERTRGAKPPWREFGCAGCHAELPRAGAVGPSKQELQQRYAKSDAAELERLIDKVRTGGAGSFGERLMPPHPGLSAAARKQLVRSVLAPERIRELRADLPLGGEFTVPVVENELASSLPRGAADPRVLVLRAERAPGEDRESAGERAGKPRQATDIAELALRAAHFPAADFDASAGVEVTAVRGGAGTGSREGVVPQEEGAWLRFGGVDARGFDEVSLWLVGKADASGALLELRVGAPDGELLGEPQVLRFADGALTEVSFALDSRLWSAGAGRDLFAVFRKGRARTDYVLLSLDFH